MKNKKLEEIPQVITDGARQIAKDAHKEWKKNKDSWLRDLSNKTYLSAVQKGYEGSIRQWTELIENNAEEK